MIANATQNQRMIAISTPLGPDEVLLQSISGSEGISRLFEFDLELLSANHDIDPLAIVGEPVTVSIDASGDDPRYFNGFIREFRYCGPAADGSRYRATMSPWLWFLSRTTDCRIYQDKNIPDILEDVFRRYGFNDYDLGLLRGTYSPRENCVQYRETALEFASRLMEEEGIFYYFRHEDGKHTLFLADHKTGYAEDVSELDYPMSETGVDSSFDVLTNWERCYAFRTGKWAQSDYNFKSPRDELGNAETSVLPIHGATNYEFFDYPGEYTKRDRGEALTRVRMEEEESFHNLVTGSSTSYFMQAADRIKPMRNVQAIDEKSNFAILSVEHAADVGGAYLTEIQSGSAYTNRFIAIPDDQTYRPPRETPKAIVEGPQTAVVVGPPGEEIAVDEFARVRCHFHWDRHKPKTDETSSCWIRVSQTHAGAGFGAMSIPRIGEEVIVDFLEGDPDQPIITGRVYNGTNMPPYELPGSKSMSGIKSNTTKGGGGSNEIRMDDTAGNEELYVHGQYNMNTVVENDQSATIHANRTVTVDGNETITVSGETGRTATITNKDELTVTTGDRTVTVQTGNDTTTITTGDMTQSVITGNAALNVISGDQSVTVNAGNAILTVAASNRDVLVPAGTYSLTANEVSIVGTSKITIGVGGSAITISAAGVEITAPKITSAASAVQEISGAIVKIN